MGGTSETSLLISRIRDKLSRIASKRFSTIPKADCGKLRFDPQLADAAAELVEADVVLSSSQELPANCFHSF